MTYYGAIEAGGTKFCCAIGNEHGDIIEEWTIPTEHPEKTVQTLIPFFQQYEIAALGVGSFGPIGVQKDDPSYGYIMNTPKVEWKHYPFIPELEKQLGVPMSFTTDVNAAALGELTKGAAKGLSSCMYITVGTGIGAGAVVKNELLHGHSHPEMGHILVRQHESDQFAGVCPAHGTCLEGLAAGPAIEARWGKPAKELTQEEAVWSLEADYLAQALMQYTLILSPERIIMGGGVMKQKQLFPLIREKLAAYVNDYVDMPPLDTYIVSPGLEDKAGMTGALLLAIEAKRNA
ncbi:ROK family protein [Bacillus sp. ms-22]|uniref:ROK family protein n=1 Tax=Bacillus sp. ms-22 TaxID=2683680 RepID=UPI0012FBCC2D|nr:ROK family protein [Bacillus sp. ms-22]QGX64735.1 ROK family protein [Bacillus sp. ms-22]